MADDLSASALAAAEALAKSAWRKFLLRVRGADICANEVGEGRTNLRAESAG